MKLEHENYRIEKVSFPIQFQVFTAEFFEAEKNYLQELYFQSQEMFNFKNLHFASVIGKSKYGRVVLAESSLEKNSYYAIKYIYKWKMCKWSADDHFQKLTLGLAKFKPIDGICELLHASVCRTFLFIVTRFYKFGSVYQQIRTNPLLNESVAKSIAFSMLRVLQTLHSQKRIALTLQSDHIMIDSNGTPLLQILSSQKFNSEAMLSKRYNGESSYFCKLVV